jgi:hypothetical protein
MERVLRGDADDLPHEELLDVAPILQMSHLGPYSP